MNKQNRSLMIVLGLGIVGLFIVVIAGAYFYAVRNATTDQDFIALGCRLSGSVSNVSECCYPSVATPQSTGFQCHEAPQGITGIPTFLTPTPTSGGSTPAPTSSGCGPAGCDGDTRPQCYPYVAGSSQLSIQNSDCSVKRTGDSCTQKNGSGQSTGVAGKCQSAPSCSCVANAAAPTSVPTAAPTQATVIEQQPTAAPTSADVTIPQPTSTGGSGDSTDFGSLEEALGGPTPEPTLSPEQIADPNVTVEPTEPFQSLIGYDFVSGITAVQTNLPRMIITFLSLLFVVALGLLAIALIINEYLKRQNN